MPATKIVAGVGGGRMDMYVRVWMRGTRRSVCTVYSSAMFDWAALVRFERGAGVGRQQDMPS